MDFGFIVIDTNEMSDDQLNQLLSFLDAITEEQIEKTPEGG